MSAVTTPTWIETIGTKSSGPSVRPSWSKSPVARISSSPGSAALSAACSSTIEPDASITKRRSRFRVGGGGGGSAKLASGHGGNPE